MGTPTPWPLESTACADCWGAGKAFNQYITPVFIQAVVSGITKGPLWTPPWPDPPNGLHELEWLSNCMWICYDGNIAHRIYYSPSDSNYTVYLFLPMQLAGGSTPGCVRSVSFNYTDYPGIYAGGHAEWTWLGGP